MVAIKMWRERPAIRAQYKNFIEFWDYMSQGRFDIDTEIEKINKSLKAAKEKETKAATAGSKKETKIVTEHAGRSASTPTSDEDVFERLFNEHTARMQDLRRDLRVNSPKISACFPKLAEELEKSVDEMSAAWSENNLELFKEAIVKTERIYKKAAVIAEGSHPLL